LFELSIGTAERDFKAVSLGIPLLIHQAMKAKNSAVESPHMRTPVNASNGASIRHVHSLREKMNSGPKQRGEAAVAI
jgi:hypothetical protein